MRLFLNYYRVAGLLACVLVLIITNPNFASFERFVLKGMNGNQYTAENFKSVFSNIELSKVVSRDNYGIFSMYEISPSLIASMQVEPNTFTFNTTDIRVRFIGIGSHFYGLSSTENGVKFMHGYLELCRVGAIDCDNFLRKYKL